MKILVTGGNRGLGRRICERTEAISISRSNGFNISEAEARAKIASLSLDFDLFVNNAFDGPPLPHAGDLGQVRLLGEVARAWTEKDKRGYILNIGSIATIYPIKAYQSFELYRAAKLALDHASFGCTRAFLSGNVPFRTTLVRFGRLDTPLNRAKSNWTGHGHDLDNLVDSILSLVRAPADTCAFTLDMDTRLSGLPTPPPGSPHA